MSRYKGRGFEEQGGSGTASGERAGFSEPRRTAEDYVHARAAGGEIDHAALSREFMVRFPKIRAALAK